MEATNWLAIILAVIMATPPLIAQLLDGIGKARQASADRKAQMASEGKTAIEEWKSLYNQCDDARRVEVANNGILEAQNDALKAENSSLKVENATLKLAMDTMKEGQVAMRDEIISMKAEIITLKTEVGTLNGTVADLRKELAWVKKERDAAEKGKERGGD